MNIFKLLLISFTVITLTNTVANAVEIQVQGQGKAPYNKKSDIITVQQKAKKEATEKAIVQAVNRVLGANSSQNPQVQAKLNDIVSQLNVYKINENISVHKEKIDKRNGNYVLEATITIDEGRFRQLLSDLGVALNTNKVRSLSILTVIDEFFSTPSDLKTSVPLKEVTVYKYDKNKTYNEKENLTSKYDENKNTKSSNHTSQALAASNKETGNIDQKNNVDVNFKIKAGSSGFVNVNSMGANSNSHYSASGKHKDKSSIKGDYVSNNAYAKKDVKESSASSDYSKKKSMDYGKFVDASHDEHEFFTNIKEYQPKCAIPEKHNFTVSHIQSKMQESDLKVLDNALFRSKYFKNEPITVDKLENSSELLKYAKFARIDANADYFAIGTAVIIDNGRNPHIGACTCDGLVTVKVYSTLDGEAIASGSITESAAGNSPDQCRAVVANKIGSNLGGIISNKVQEYSKKREMYGSQYTVTIKGNFKPVEKIHFLKTIKSIQNVSLVERSKNTSESCIFTVTYKGEDAFADLLFMQLLESPLASKVENYDYSDEGSQIILFPMEMEEKL